MSLATTLQRLCPPAVAALLAVAGLAGCGSIGSGGRVDKTLEFVGLKKPEVPEEAKAVLPPQPKKLTLRVHAGDQLNVDPQMRSLSIVVRIYKLRSSSAFLLAPYKSFGNADAEKLAFGGDLLDVREVVLTPGQRHEVVETLPLDATHLAVVALFRAPAEGRWRFAFKAKESEKTGVTLGLHGCAMSVASGVTDNAEPDTLRLAGVRCQ